MKDSLGYMYNIEIPLFLNYYKTQNVLKLDATRSISLNSAINISLRSSLMGMIGESFERYAMSFGYLPNKQASFWAIDMGRKELVKINRTDCGYIDLYFNDSCGMASHLHSCNCLENALSEFIERQSFILSYLSRANARRIIKNERMIQYIPIEYAFLDFFEISLIKSYKVIFAIGAKNETIYCALGAGYTLEEALMKTIKEAHMSSAKQGSIKQAEGLKPDYLHLFHMLSIEQIMNAYSYLWNGETIEFDEGVKNTREEVIKELNDECGMRVLVMAIMNKRYNNMPMQFAKNLKVFSPGWFTSLEVGSMPTEVYDNVEKHTNLKLRREVNFIPFP